MLAVPQSRVCAKHCHLFLTSVIDLEASERSKNAWVPICNCYQYDEDSSS